MKKKRKKRRNKLSAYYKGFTEGIRPSEELTVSQWADRFRKLSTRASAEPGPWRTERTPYLKEIMDCLSADSDIERVAFMKGAQVGGTECGNNWIGYVIDHMPGPMMCVQPTVEMAQRNSKQRIAPLIAECPQLKLKVQDPREKDSSNTILSKEFPGGILILTGANSGVGLRSLPAKYLFLDEIDAFPSDIGKEGSPILLAEARTRTFYRRKIFYNSTPTVAGRSAIHKAYLNGDQRKFFVPCTRCGAYQTLEWRQVKWDKGDEANAWYQCEHCDGRIENWEKTQMLAAGEWRPTAKGIPRCASFHLSSLYSPPGWVGWGALAQEWRASSKSPERLRGFINTCLGEVWQDKGEAPDWKRLYEKRERYPANQIPEPVVVLTMGVDVQRDRIECEIVGWGKDKQSWSIDYRIFTGDTASLSSPAWQELDQTINETWELESGAQMPLRMVAIDSGFNTQTVYSFVRKYQISKVIAVKGFDHQTTVINSPKPVDVMRNGKKVQAGVKVFPVGINTIKQELYGWLRMPSPDEGEEFPQGYCHFPEYGEDYFKQLTAEEMVVKTVKGYQKVIWEKIRDRNEALDCRVYARAAAALVGVDRMTRRHVIQRGVKKPADKATIKRQRESIWADSGSFWD